MREYNSDYDDTFHDIRNVPASDPVYDPNHYKNSQNLAKMLKIIGSNGIIYKSVRDPNGNCIVCFRPKLILKVRQGNHYECKWDNSSKLQIRQLGNTT
jgi:hypothetical protein